MYLNDEISDFIKNEGLGNAIQHYVDWKEIKDPKLAKMWEEAAKLLNNIENYLGVNG